MIRGRGVGGTSDRGVEPSPSRNMQSSASPWLPEEQQHFTQGTGQPQPSAFSAGCGIAPPAQSSTAASAAVAKRLRPMPIT